MNKNLRQQKKQVIYEVDELANELKELALELHDNPEMAFEEYNAAEYMTEILEENGCPTEKGIAGMDTAFRASYEGSSKRPAVALLAEYDALPDIGHACGHNLIATASLGAVLALKKAPFQITGTVELLGTPAEEGGGGKVVMVEEGLFDDIDAAMMFHPSSRNLFVRGGLAATQIKMSFHGKPAHAASSPEHGINALDAVIQTFVALNALREHVTDDVRIHGIITHGGDAPNIVPEYTEASVIVRADTRENLKEVKKRVLACAEGAATATGASFEYEESFTYAERNNNHTMAGLFEQNIGQLGIKADPPQEKGGVGSSDIGNVSVTIPAIHPYLKIADESVAGHTHEFAEASRSDKGLQAMLDAAKGLAMTVLDVLEDKENLEKIKTEFKKEEVPE